MTEQTNLVPKRRFKEFQNTYAWEQRKLKNMLDKVIDNRGKTPPVLDKGKHPMLEVASLGGFLPDYSKVAKFVDEETFDTWFRNYLQEQDVLFSTVGNTGLTSLMDENINAVIAQNIVGFRFIDAFDPNFMVQMFKQKDNLKKVKRIEMGAVQPSVKVSQLVDIIYKFPSFEEQTQIGNFFKQFDETIALQQRKLEKTKALKSAYLFEMFPAEGEREPKRRFAGFTQAWDQRKLRDIADFSKGTGYSKSDLTNEGKPIILYGRLYTNYKTVIESVDTFTIEKEKSVISRGNEVIVPSSGETSQDISRASVVRKSGIILGGDLNIIRPSDEIDSTFLALTISNGTQQKELSKRAQGKSVVHLHNSDLQEIDLIFPEKKEQTQIGDFFKQLDDAIALYERKLEKLQNIKKAYLNEMFI